MLKKYNLTVIVTDNSKVIYLVKNRVDLIGIDKKQGVDIIQYKSQKSNKILHYIGITIRRFQSRLKSMSHIFVNLYGLAPCVVY